MSPFDDMVSKIAPPSVVKRVEAGKPPVASVQPLATVKPQPPPDFKNITKAVVTEEDLQKAERELETCVQECESKYIDLLKTEELQKVELCKKVTAALQLNANDQNERVKKATEEFIAKLDGIRRDWGNLNNAVIVDHKAQACFTQCNTGMVATNEARCTAIWPPRFEVRYEPGGSDPIAYTKYVPQKVSWEQYSACSNPDVQMGTKRFRPAGLQRVTRHGMRDPPMMGSRMIRDPMMGSRMIRDPMMGSRMIRDPMMGSRVMDEMY
jgi:hypothetical protein